MNLVSVTVVIEAMLISYGAWRSFKASRLHGVVAVAMEAACDELGDKCLPPWYGT